MNKHVLLFCSMLIALPAMADENVLPPLPCSGVVESATEVMSKMYSIDADQITVGIMGVSKLEKDTELTSHVLTTNRSSQCDMVWSTPTFKSAINFCAPELVSISCKPMSQEQKGLAELFRQRQLTKASQEKGPIHSSSLKLNEPRMNQRAGHQLPDTAGEGRPGASQDQAETGA
jgi:hypothetical protein